MDVWVNPTTKNYQKLMLAFRTFGLPTTVLPLAKFLNIEAYDVFTFGISPMAIDIMTKVKGLDFQSSLKNCIIYKTEGVEIKLIHYNQLIQAKKSSGRLKDLADIEYLEQE